MKSLIKKTFILSFIALGIVSCSEDSASPKANDSEVLNLTSPDGGSYVLQSTAAGDEVFVARWTSADYNYQAAVNYKLQLVKASDTFDGANVGSFDLGNFSSTSGASFEKSLTVREFNSMILGANGSIGSAESYKVRVVASVNGQLNTSDNNLTNAVSQEVTLTATAYDTFDEFSRIYVPGNYQGNSGYGSDWSPDNANVGKLFSKANNGIYEGFVWMNNATPAFKFTPVPSWTDDKGENNPSGAFSGVLGTASDIKPADGAGTYFFTVNWTNLTYTMDKYQIAIIGDATPNGWGTPTYLTFDTDPASPYYQMYTIDLPLVVGNDGFLIRLKDDWSQKMGTLSGNTENTTTGGQYKIKIGGGNMKVPAAGNYKVVLDIRNSANYNIRLMPN